MTPASVLSNFGEEMIADPTLELQVYYRASDEVFVVEVNSNEEERSVQAEGRKVKTALAKALNRWNGDEERCQDSSSPSI